MRIPKPANFQELDLLVVQYIDELDRDGECVIYAGHLISGLKRFVPQCCFELLTSAAYFRNWRRELIAVRAPPLHVEIAQGMAASAASINRWDLAACIFQGFAFFLVPSEIFSLNVKDIAIFSNTTLAVALHNTNIGRFNAVSVHLGDGKLCLSIAFALRGR